MNKKLSIPLFIISALPLLLYPLVLIVNIMSLAGYSFESEPFILGLISNLFLWGTTLYPIVYFYCLTRFIFVKSESKKKIFALIPYLYLLICAALFFSWIIVEELSLV